jgi:ribonuclease HI
MALAAGPVSLAGPSSLTTAAKCRNSMAHPKTTNNRMELAAILGALKNIPSGLPVMLYTDSLYSQKALTYQWKNWRHNNWLTQDGKPVKNRQIIERILEEMVRIGAVEITHVERNSS